MRKLELIALAAATVVVATPAAAQGRGRGDDGVPPGQRPPAGMCRIWIDGVPPGQQPAATSCALAEARRPANARVIYGDETPFPGRGRHENVSNGRVVTIDGRRCSERVDALGNASYDCPTTSQSNVGLGGIFGRRSRTVDSQGRVLDSQGRVLNRSGDDEDNDERVDRGDRDDDDGGRGIRGGDRGDDEGGRGIRRGDQDEDGGRGVGRGDQDEDRGRGLGRGKGHKHGKHGRDGDGD